MYTPTSSHPNSHLSGNQQNFFIYCYDGNQDLQRKENIMKIWQKINKFKRKLKYIHVSMLQKKEREIKT